MGTKKRLLIFISVLISIIILCLILVACQKVTPQEPVPPIDSTDKPIEKPKPDDIENSSALTIFYIDMGITTEVEYKDQDIINLMVPNPRKGYIFSYWTAEDGSPIINSSINNNSSVDTITLTAVWKPEDYTLKLKYNDGTQKVTEQNYNIETDSFVLPSPTRLGYIFLGWFNGSYPSPIQEIKRGTTGFLELSAKWKIETYIINYQNVSPDFTAKEEYNIDTNDFTLPTPTKDRCEFLGWFDNKSLYGDRIYSVPKGSNGNLTLYAKWSAPKYTISYELFGGTAKDLIYDYSKDLALINLDRVTPTKQDHKFMGWFLHPDCIETSKINIINTSSAVDYKLFAGWTSDRTTANIAYSSLKCMAPNADSLNLADHSDCHYTVTGINTTPGNVFNVANTYLSKPVIAVDRLAFQSLKGATINLPNNILTIGEEAFRDCQENTVINLPSNLKTIGKKSFYNTSRISTIIPSSVEGNLGSDIFANSKNCSFVIQEGVTALPYQAFSLSVISEIILPVSLQSIGDNAFAGATITSRLKLGGNVSYWGGGMFTNSKINRLDIDRAQSNITYTSLFDLYDYENDFCTPISLSLNLANYITSELYFRIMGFYNSNFKINFNCSTVNANASLLGHYSSNEYTHTLEEICISRKMDNNINGIKDNYILDLKSINTIAHETRHYFQNLCFKKRIKTVYASKIPLPLTPSEQEIATWDPSKYISASDRPDLYPMYYHQPVEEDARRVATEITGYLPKHTPCALCPQN